jgi:hypothetical protein
VSPTSVVLPIDLLVHEDNLIIVISNHCQLLVIIYGLLIRILTYQPTVDKTIVLGLSKLGDSIYYNK